MKELKFTKETRVVALVFFIAYFFYGLFRLPFLQYLVSLAAGAIAYGISDSYEIASLTLLIMNFFFPMLKGKEAFTSREGFMGSNAAEISRRVGGMKMGGVITGVGSPMTEGFEDAKAPDLTLAETKIPSENSTATTAASAPAPANTTAQAFASGPSNTAPTPQPVAQTAPAPPAPTAISNQGVPPVHQPATNETFQDNGSLFKLGQIPQDAKGGFHIDAGTTVINALNSLKPDQISAMTKDTKQLIETQKSLMNMLQTFSPMVNEGKQMMETFNSMFSPAMGSLQNAQNMLGAAK